jgi:hypothetical protein
LLRVYSYLYHLALALFLLGISLVAVISSNRLRLPILPWSDDELTTWLIWGSILGLTSVLLAVSGIFRYLFPLWSLIVVILMVRGYILQPLPFATREDFYTAMWLLGGAILAFLASLTLLRVRPRRA